MNDTRKATEVEARISADREPVDGPPEGSPDVVACPSNTQLSTRQRKEKDGQENPDHQPEVAQLTGTTGIDWWQLSACVAWDHSVAAEHFAELNRLKERAQEQQSPAAYKLGDDWLNVDRRGHGRGNDSHKEIQFFWNGAVIGLSQRTDPTRQFSNASLTVSGEPCLVTGFGKCWERFHRVISNMGGTVFDEWIRRFDLCIDIPHLSLEHSLADALRNHQFVSHIWTFDLHETPKGLTGFAIGKSNRARVVIYDKLTDVFDNHHSVYQQAMVQSRWGGVMPSCATRVEFQIGREWLAQYDMRTSDCIVRIGDIYEKLTGPRGSTFRVTAAAIDRQNRHQSRAETHPVWNRIIEIGRETVGECLIPVARLDRTSLDERKAAKQIVGFATSMADRRRVVCQSRDQLLDVIRQGLTVNGIDDDYVRRKWEAKARLSGTWQELKSFPPNEAA